MIAVSNAQLSDRAFRRSLPTRSGEGGSDDEPTGGIHETTARPGDFFYAILAKAPNLIAAWRRTDHEALRGLNFFSRAEQTLLSALQRPAFNIAGLRRADLLPLLAQSSPATLTRHLARLRQLGVIKRLAGTYRYYLTRAGRAAIAAGRRLTEHAIIPALAQ